MNPIDLFTHSLDRAERTGLTLPNAMALATVGADGKPATRMMLLKGVDARGFVFYTNLKSRKGEELQVCPHAALCFWWPELEEQVRIEGKVRPVIAKEADAYFATRPRGSQIGAWASEQSEPLPSRAKLLAAVEKFERKFRGKKVPRPPHWSGFILAPERIEFWHGRPDRLHDRLLYLRRGKGWKKELLYP